MDTPMIIYVYIYIFLSSLGKLYASRISMMYWATPLTIAGRD